MTFRSKPLSLVALLAAAIVLLVGCSSSDSPSSGTANEASSSSDGTWPRTVTHEAGETTIPAKPKNIVSTSVSVTGTLLAIGAPVTASAATKPGPTTDGKGFFTQWASVADERGVTVLYPNLALDIESVIAAKPDLIVVSTSGADSVLPQYKELSAIAPTVVVNYGDKTWQDLATQLGAATGQEESAKKVTDEFNAYVADAATKIKAPTGTTSIVAFNGAKDSAVAKTTGTHAKLYTALGFTVVQAPDGLDTSEQKRDDVAWVTLENLSKAVAGDTVMLMSGTDETVKQFKSTPVLANLAAVKSGAVHPMGNSFRLDYYSAKQLVDLVKTQFAS
ncbi:Fe2+-enterobactin ABC transporter substrate-binding protein [Rhodococcus sp. X156]|uniref:Fe2+-enterobactin ABC transporter substrate-binding protein n=1 Tax=Rhodococcus sp. X156 TaxID=2499145 RepID=UPI0019CF6227|nr:Fe2+-enterobactin ABC transporter substrate-binding protein [Rhodococcus sp. X156]